MVNPTLWGPHTWNILFACAWVCPKKKMERLIRLCTVLVPELLPCEKCRNHYKRKSKRAADAKVPRLEDPTDVFLWLWHLKQQTHSHASQNILFPHLCQRYTFHGPLFSDVAVADVLVLFAFHAESLGMHDQFRDMCAILHELLPTADDAELKLGLADVTSGKKITLAAMRIARQTRIEHGLPTQTAAHYKRIATEEG